MKGHAWRIVAAIDEAALEAIDHTIPNGDSAGGLLQAGVTELVDPKRRVAAKKKRFLFF